MNEQITPFFNSIEIQEAELKLAKQSGAYAQDLECFLAIEFLLSYKGSKDTVASYRREIEKDNQKPWPRRKSKSLSTFVKNLRHHG